MFKKISPYNFLVTYISKIKKRQRFIIATFCLSFLMLFSTFLSFNQLKYYILILGVLTYFFTFFSILERIQKIEWATLFIHPIYFTIVFDLFFFLLPVRWLTRIPFISIYAISIYAILLSSNIFNVRVVKSLQLNRSAFSINYLFLTLTSFLVVNLILSFKLNFLFNLILISIFLFPLALQFFWVANPQNNLDRGLIKYAFLVSLYIGEIALIFSFIPLRQIIFSLLLTACFYSLLGLFYAYIEGRLFVNRVKEFLLVLIIIFIITALSIG
ncbi:MAG: hypothetical protein ACD_12C00801G0001 [uncultured bacterium]|nr:MAG: hypothetical protein ACD_12C00801G0001 [uncultured bacterium]